MKDDFSEGNSWQYTWLVPQDVKDDPFNGWGKSFSKNWIHYLL
jgi:putative alpha-1,2-mannosidase